MNKFKLVAILRNVDPANVPAIADILLEEGITSMEVSLSEPTFGFGCLEALRQRYGDTIHLGAGTVASHAQINRLKQLNIGYIFTPGFDAELVDYALQQGMQVIPGVLTPSDVQQAVNRGLSLLKLFPANTFSMGYIKSLSGPFPSTRYLAVGGVEPDNIATFFKAGFVGVGVGSSLVPQRAGTAQLPAIRSAARICAETAYQKQEF